MICVCDHPQGGRRFCPIHGDVETLPVAEYERIKREIGWHATAWDCWAVVVLLAAVALIAWLT